ncbi:hypothetical protein GCM10022243_33830 [Saccharothrix violaceirubra]|uniref:BRCT domain-containing protein n=1 Tax=Saccharothrix violaceirubra TaxID=413306 RepID=A0A7W7WXB7_9PSEU|nr:hypothetical protein [Saccharothrix violaceirubra]MBB4966438.1 hypothetical protein [Saccharothrix violaceirubra]
MEWLKRLFRPRRKDAGHTAGVTAVSEPPSVPEPSPEAAPGAEPTAGSEPTPDARPATGSEATAASPADPTPEASAEPTPEVAETPAPSAAAAPTAESRTGSEPTPADDTTSRATTTPTDTEAPAPVEPAPVEATPVEATPVEHTAVESPAVESPAVEPAAEATAEPAASGSTTPDAEADPVTDAESSTTSDDPATDPEPAVADSTAEAAPAATTTRLKGWRVGVDGGTPEVEALARLVTDNGGAIAKRVTASVRFVIAADTEGTGAVVRQARVLSIAVLTVDEATRRLHEELGIVAASTDVEAPAEPDAADRAPVDVAEPTPAVVDDQAPVEPPVADEATTGQAVPVQESESTLAPGHVRGRFHTEWIAKLDELRTAKQDDEALSLLLELVDAAEGLARTEGSAPAPAYTERAAVILRRRKDYAAEITLLERWQAAHPGEPTGKLVDRLAAARKLQDKAR